MRKPTLILSYLLVATALLLSGCKYTFKSGSTGNAKTLLVKTFLNEAGGGPPSLTQSFAEKLRSYYQENSKLLLRRNGEADWTLEGKIVGYTVTPVAPAAVGSQQTGTSNLNRLTIRIQVKFTDVLYENDKSQSKPFDQVFSFYADFPQNQTLSQVEGTLVDQILNQIVLDVFTKTLSEDF